MTLFEHKYDPDNSMKPLAERMRPKKLAGFAGQDHAVGEGSIIRHTIESDNIFSMILWGPPGCGKTTLAEIIAHETSSRFIRLSAVLSGVKDIRAIIDEADKRRKIYQKKTILFVDEIHRFNKSQQDAFLPHVESGLITLIGATTENPSFEIIAPLLSRCRVITLNSLSEEDLRRICKRALNDKEKGLGKNNFEISDKALWHLVKIADGDARAALNNLEIAASLAMEKGLKKIGLDEIEKALQRDSFRYDKSGEEHYNLISAFHKSLRGSDPDAALYWLSRMLSSGEDPMYIARRMVRFASEDVGNADPYALRISLDAVESYRFLGSPEGELALAQAAVYLATAPKSNSIYTAFASAREAADKYGALPVPFHIRNAPTKLMKNLGYGKNYKYAHNYKDGFVPQDYLPDKLLGSLYYHPTNRGYENMVKQRLEKWRALKESSKK